MLSEKVFLNILANLSREDLEALQLVNADTDHFVRTEMTDGPRRYMKCLVVARRSDYRVEHHKFVVYMQQLSDFKMLMKHVGVDWLIFGDDLSMDKALLNDLLPLKSSWDPSHCAPPHWFSSRTICERTYNELLLVKSLTIDPDANPLLMSSRAFLSFQAVLRCKKLRLFDPPYDINFIDACAGCGFHDEDRFISELKKTFLHAEKSRNWIVEIYTRNSMRTQILLNYSTFEWLIIYPLHDYAVRIDVDR